LPGQRPVEGPVRVQVQQPAEVGDGQEHHLRRLGELLHQGPVRLREVISPQRTQGAQRKTESGSNPALGFSLRSLCVLCVLCGYFLISLAALTGSGWPSVSPLAWKPPPSTSTKTGLLMAVGRYLPQKGPM